MTRHARLVFSLLAVGFTAGAIAQNVTLVKDIEAVTRKSSAPGRAAELNGLT